MKKIIKIPLFIVLIFLGSCKKTGSEFTICGDGCPYGPGWRVETLDLALPCFMSKEECLTWAESHGYSGHDCVLCD